MVVPGGKTFDLLTAQRRRIMTISSVSASSPRGLKSLEWTRESEDIFWLVSERLSINSIPPVTASQLCLLLFGVSFQHPDILRVLVESLEPAFDNSLSRKPQLRVNTPIVLLLTHTEYGELPCTVPILFDLLLDTRQHTIPES